MRRPPLKVEYDTTTDRLIATVPQEGGAPVERVFFPQGGGGGGSDVFAEFDLQTDGDDGDELAHSIAVAGYDDGHYTWTVEIDAIAHDDDGKTIKIVRACSIIGDDIVGGGPEITERDNGTPNTSLPDAAAHIVFNMDDGEVEFYVHGNTALLIDWHAKIFRNFVVQSGDSPTSTPPTVSAISPDVGDFTGGVPVTITGTAFTGATGATIGGVAITSFVVVNDTTITGVTGAHAIATGQSVVVTSPGGSNAANTLYEYFNPLSISGCVWWLRPDYGLSTSSGEVIGWNDQAIGSDANRHLAPFGVDKPAYNATDASYNNKPTVGTFNKTGAANNCRLITAGAWSATYTNNFTLAVIGHAITTSNRYFTVMNESVDAISLSNQANTPTVYSAGFTTPLPASGPGALATAKCFMMAEFALTSSKLFLNGTETPDATGTLASSVLGASPFKIGSYPASADTYGVERIAELFAYNKILSTPERVRLRKYLNGRYNKSMTT